MAYKFQLGDFRASGSIVVEETLEAEGFLDVLDSKLRIDGAAVTVSSTELNYMGGVTSAVQTQFGSATTDRAAIRTEAAAESTARVAAEAAIQADVNQNEADSDASHSAATVDRAAIRTEATNESSARVAAEAAIQADVNQNEADADASIAAALADRGAIRTDFAAADAAQLVALKGDVAGSYDTLGKLEDKIQLEEGRIDAILSASTADTDTFAEVVELINSVDATNDSAFAGHVLAYNTKMGLLDAEDVAIRAAFAAGDTALVGGATGAGDTLKKLEDRLVAEIAATNGDFTSAATARAALQTDVDQNEADADAGLAAALADRGAIRGEFAAADTALIGGATVSGNTLKKLEDRLVAEITATNADFGSASAARTALQADVDQNESDSDASHSAATVDRAAIRTEATTESTARVAAEAAIQADVNQNEADSDAAHSAATVDRGAIRTEFAAADAAQLVLLKGDVAGSYDTLGKLEDKIQLEEGRIDAILSASVADKDSFKEIVDLINSVDATNDSAFAGHVSAYNTKMGLLDAEDVAIRAAFAAADAALQADVDQNEADSDAAHSAATVDRAAIRTEATTESTARVAAEGALSYRIDDSVSTFTEAGMPASLSIGYSFLSSSLTANRSMTLPAAPVLGQKVHVKVSGVGAYRLDIMKGNAAHSLDGGSSVSLESDYSAVTFVYVGGNKWSIF